MKVLVFGATGGTGRQLVQQALQQGHVVTAFARDPAKLETVNDKLHIVRGDVLDLGSVEKAVAGQDAVLSALGIRLPVKIVLLIVVACQVIVRTVALPRPVAIFVEVGVPILSILLMSRRKTVLSDGTRNIFADKEEQERIIAGSNLDWVIVRPTALTNGPQRNVYRAGTDVGHWLVPSRISRADVAAFMLKQLTGEEYLRKAPGLSY